MHISDWSSDVCSSDLYGRNLYGRERAIVVIAFDAGQSIDQLLVAHHETDSPTGHVVAFAHGEELDGDIARTLDLHDGRRHIAVEGDVGVSQIVNHQNIVLFGQGDDRSEEHTSELQSLMRISYAVFCLKKKNKTTTNHTSIANKK